MQQNNDSALQTEFLRKCVDDRIFLTLFLMNGIKLSGLITKFDKYSVELTRDGASQLIHKHAIATIVPGESARKSTTHNQV